MSDTNTKSDVVTVQWERTVFFQSGHAIVQLLDANGENIVRVQHDNDSQVKFDIKLDPMIDKMKFFDAFTTGPLAAARMFHLMIDENYSFFRAERYKPVEVSFHDFEQFDDWVSRGLSAEMAALFSIYAHKKGWGVEALDALVRADVLIHLSPVTYESTIELFLRAAAVSDPETVARILAASEPTLESQSRVSNSIQKLPAYTHQLMSEAPRESLNAVLSVLSKLSVMADDYVIADLEAVYSFVAELLLDVDHSSWPLVSEIATSLRPAKYYHATAGILGVEEQKVKRFADALLEQSFYDEGSFAYYRDNGVLFTTLAAVAFRVYGVDTVLEALERLELSGDKADSLLSILAVARHMHHYDREAHPSFVLDMLGFFPDNTLEDDDDL